MRKQAEEKFLIRRKNRDTIRIVNLIVYKVWDRTKESISVDFKDSIEISCAGKKSALKIKEALKKAGLINSHS
jgi:hypothetical protein